MGPSSPTARRDPARRTQWEARQTRYPSPHRRRRYRQLRPLLRRGKKRRETSLPILSIRHPRRRRRACYQRRQQQQPMILRRRQPRDQFPCLLRLSECRRHRRHRICSRSSSSKEEETAAATAWGPRPALSLGRCLRCWRTPRRGSRRGGSSC